MIVEKGQLYIVATPIGNLQDITYRAIDTLNNVDIIVAEDTRNTRELLNHFNIKTHLISFNEYASDNKTDNIIEKLLDGFNIAMVSDAGTPLISDPGIKLTKACIENDINIISIPGACAAINALVLSGLRNNQFKFIGFLSEDNKKRKEELSDIENEKSTLIFYISLHNLKDDLKDLVQVFGKDRLASLSREMTKKYEETIRGTLDSIYNYVNENNLKGEFVLVVQGIEKKELKEKEIDKWSKMSIEDHYNMYLEDGFSDKDAMKKVALDRGLNKRDIYKIIKLKE